MVELPVEFSRDTLLIPFFPLSTSVRDTQRRFGFRLIPFLWRNSMHGARYIIHDMMDLRRRLATNEIRSLMYEVVVMMRSEVRGGG